MSKRLVIVLDPGHGGADRRNVGPTGYVEADGNLAFCQYAFDYMMENYEVDIHLTRYTDKTLTLSSRPKKAATLKADVFISVHSDAFSSESSGTTVFTSIHRADNYDLAEKVGNAISDSMGIPFRGVRTRESQKNKGMDYYTVIAVAHGLDIENILLLERGFHSNPKEEAKLKDPRVIKASVLAFCDAIASHFNLKKKYVYDHWAEGYYQNIKDWLDVKEKDYERPIKRGEVFKLLSNLKDIIEKK